ncbi:helix-turn-helix domain-containing protein [Haladaptatus sp. NG-WS-4]
MITIALDMEQYDCPFIDTSDDYDVSFATLHWDFDPGVNELETRIVVEGATQGTLENGLHALTNHENLHEYELLSKRGDTAQIRTIIGETNAMEIIRDNDGYITGPFSIENGSELWNVGFDSPRVTDDVLAKLETENDFDVVSRDRLEMSMLQEFAQNVEAGMSLVEGCCELSDVERKTLSAAVRGGYFDTPREATLSTIGEQFDVSEPAVSKNLRRAQRKILLRVVDAVDELD